MGNSPIQHHDPKRIRQQVYDDRFGGKIILEYQKPQIFATKTILMTSIEQVNTTIKLIKRRAKLRHTNFSTVKNYTEHDKTDLCSDIIPLNIVFQFYENNLEKQILRREPQHIYFTEQQICKKIFQICDCLVYLQQRQCYHGDIKPSTIFLDRQGEVKLHDSSFTNFAKTNLQFIYFNKNTRTYLSPYQLNFLKQVEFRQQQQKDQLYKNDIFSMGMTILQAMLLENLYDCYNMLKKQVIKYKLQKKLFKARSKYSLQLVSLIGSMISVQSKNRINYYEILRNQLIDRYSYKKSLIQKYIIYQISTNANSRQQLL